MIRTLLIVGLLATSTSAASARTLVGKWDCDGRDGANLAIRMLLDYRQSGHFYHLANVAVGDRRGRLDAAVALKGKWFRNHSNLKETVNHARVRTLTANGRDFSKTPYGRQIVRALPKQMKGSNGVSNTKVKFLSSTKVKMSSGRMNVTCTKR
ncbi:hypothetical protein ABMC88_13825 [Sulfitobacter sp. HNIBRBA2951]|uniref:hypothetical protein n=1 Tax=Sulfitobacter aquimarinus TaxID=3158557 RepID=UPI0032DE6DF3